LIHFYKRILGIPEKLLVSKWFVTAASVLVTLPVSAPTLEMTMLAARAGEAEARGEEVERKVCATSVTG